MALSFRNAATDRVGVGSRATLANIAAGTTLAWVYREATADQRIWQKGSAAAGTYLLFQVGSPANTLNVQRQRATTALYITSSAAVAANAWICVAASWNMNGADTDQHLYYGNLNAVCAEMALSTQTAGSGAAASDAAEILYLGNNRNFTVNWEGRIAFVGIWNWQLTLAEIQEQQFAPRLTPGCVGFWWLGGRYGTGIQWDESGFGNHGTVTGATAALDVPLPVRRERRWWYVPIAAGFQAAWAAHNNAQIGIN